MTSARFLIGDVFERMAELPDGAYDLIVTSPPFLALRSYLPDDHPDKGKEIGSEATPAEFLDTMLALTAEWGRLLAPHGSIAIEIGDTYSGSGGAGGDYGEGGLRDGHGWPEAKSLAMIPELYAASLAYGRNLLTGAESPAGRWRVRNFKPWIRSNPTPGALGDKERPATSYITVATRAVDRYFDLDAVRTPLTENHTRGHTKNRHSAHPGTGWTSDNDAIVQNQAGAPPLDWWHHVDAIIDHEIDQRAGKASGYSNGPTKTGKYADRLGDNSAEAQNMTVGARGVHIRRRLEQAGILTTLDALDISPKGYTGAHYAVWPPELVQRLINEMCPRKVCTTCGQPSRRIVDVDRTYRRPAKLPLSGRNTSRNDGGAGPFNHDETRTAVGWSDCGHGTWRPGRILDPFVGSGTTLAVATGMARHADGIDLDPRNAHLAHERVGMFLEVIDQPAPQEATGWAPSPSARWPLSPGPSSSPKRSGTGTGDPPRVS